MIKLQRLLDLIKNSYIGITLDKNYCVSYHGGGLIINQVGEDLDFIIDNIIKDIKKFKKELKNEN